MQEVIAAEIMRVEEVVVPERPAEGVAVAVPDLMEPSHKVPYLQEEA